MTDLKTLYDIEEYDEIGNEYVTSRNLKQKMLIPWVKELNKDSFKGKEPKTNDEIVLYNGEMLNRGVLVPWITKAFNFTEEELKQIE